MNRTLSNKARLEKSDEKSTDKTSYTENIYTTRYLSNQLGRISVKV